MRTQALRILGDAFIVGSWLVFVAAFLVIWAPVLPTWVAPAFILLLAMPVGHLIGLRWARFMTRDGTPSGLGGPAPDVQPPP